MEIEVILSSVVITTIISSVISFFISRRESNLHYITGERKEWREKIRYISCELQDANYKKTIKILTDLKVRINAFGNRENIISYNSDVHIWEIIGEIEKEELNIKYLRQKQKQLIEYLALLLKFDWEKSKKETRGNICSIISLVLLLVSELFFVISVCYLHVQKIKNFEWISTLITFFVLMLFFYFLVKIQAKLICTSYLNGVHGGKVKEYKKIKLWVSDLICWISGIMLMLVYIDNLKEVLRVVSCGENNLLIMLITSLLYFCGLILMGWAEVMEVDTIYYYNRGINKIKLYYEQNKAS
ncbi:MAG: hypothetical protein IKL49_02570 [Lachnospiraceae bacterium]|nr:hypothetical protein [Lachnospiraceae bacterium]